MHAAPHRVGGPHVPAILLATAVGLTACGTERRAATSNGNSEPDIVSGSYRVTAVLGQDSLGGRLDVRSDGEGARGRVTLHVGRDLHFAIRAEGGVGDTA
ncbi:MAG: hypothetical protein R3324_05350, partial [Halobacteriales archaeon]|nr:hypothetical protein [Halobacteriales archaeon]